MPIEVYVITPADVLITFVAFVVIACVAVALTALVVLPGRRTRVSESDPVEAVRTVELPRQRHGGLRTAGTIHASQYQRPSVDGPTVVIDRAGVDR